jgi:hypothetical protein
MAIWTWLHECRRQFLAKGDQPRVQLTSYYSQAYGFRETDPARALALFTEGRRLAEQLSEPWWVLFYDKFRVDAQIHFLRDFRQILDLAVHCALELRKPGFAQYPDRFGVYDSLVAAYLGIDAEGYADKIKEALTYLDKEAGDQPGNNRFLLFARQRIFAMERQAWEEAHAICLRELSLADGCPDKRTAAHFASFVHCALCQIAAEQHKWQEVADHAQLGEENARSAGHECELAEALAWQAAALRRAGQQEAAQRAFRAALARTGRLGMPPTQGCFRALSAFYRHADNLPGMLQTCQRELATISDRGRLLYEFRVQLERLKLLRRIGAPFNEQLDAAREEALAAAQRLRLAEKYAAEVNKATN